MRQRFFGQLYPLLQALWKYRYLFVMPIMILPFITVFINSIQPKTYYSHTTILVQETALMNPFLEDLSISFNLEQRMEALRVMIHSRYILNEVVDELGLAPPDSTTARNRMRNKLSKSLDLSLAGSDLIRIGLSWDDPSQMTSILSEISQQFLIRLEAPGKTSVASSEKFLEQQLTETKFELEEAEERLAEFKRDNIDNLPQLEGAQNRNINNLQTQLRETELLIMQAKSERETLKNRLVKSNPVIALLEEELLKAEAELTILRARYTDNHSEVKAVLRRVKALRAESKQMIDKQKSLSDHDLNQLWSFANNNSQTSNIEGQPLLVSQLEQYQQAETQIDSLLQKKAALKDQIEELTLKRSDSADLERQLKSLERNFDVKEKIYNRLLERFEMAQVTGQLGRFEEQDKLKVIDIPYTPTLPTNWPWWVSFIIGIVAGTGLGASLVTLLTLLDTRLYSTEHVEKIAKATVMARLPQFSKDWQ